MRIWHEQLIPKLCRQHLLAMWREGLGCYKIITEDKKGYSRHPAVKEFENDLLGLWLRLHSVRQEMLKRNYKPKELPLLYPHENKLLEDAEYINDKSLWQTLEEQIEILKSKNCDCRV